ncbi:MAG: ribosomal protein S18-alanine N-acetyltransferase [candidate division Zixibacteria bacterium]|nr:ribosomal protein S18-alanine N-acetyltransferase [candidate division Zixibacteria bacterium]
MPHLKEPKVSRKIIIERMRPEDLDQILQLEKTSFTDPWPRKGFEIQLRDGSSIMLAARLEAAAALGGEIVGYLCAYHLLEELQLASVAVREEFRRRGVAQKLIEEMIRQGRRQGAREVWLDVRESNNAARRLYEKLGFQEVYRRKNYYRRPKEDALVMFRPADEAARPSVAHNLGRAVGG